MRHTGVENDPEVILIEPGNSLYHWIEKMSNLLAGSKSLFLIDDIIVYETLDKRRHLCLTWLYQAIIEAIHYGC